MELFADNIKYKFSEEAPIGCNDCRGCDKCCKGMGNTIVQDPYDLWMFSSNMRLAGGGKITFEALISEDGPWELSVHDGLVLPNIKMVEDGRCPFLNEQGRCSIHPVRSGLCRLFPLAREYEDDNGCERVSYGVLGHEMGCERILSKVSVPGGIERTVGNNAKNTDETIKSSEKDNEIYIPTGSKVKISEWLGIPKIRKYEEFLFTWHKIKKEASRDINSDRQAKLLEIFYEKPYGDDFYAEFYDRMEIYKNDM